MSRWLPKSIAGQLMSLLFAALILSQGLTVVMFFGERDDAVREAWREEFFARVASVANLIDQTPAAAERVTSAVSSRWQTYRISNTPSPDTQPLDAGDRDLVQRLGVYVGGERVSAIRIRSRDDERETPAFLRWLDAAGGAILGRSGNDDSDKEPVLQIDVPLNDGRWLNVQLPMRGRPVAWALLPVASSAIMAAAILLIIALIVRSITRPLRNLVSAADSFGRGEPIYELEVSGPDEIQRLTTAFNEMSARLTRFIDDRTRMLAAISHDLRTPITALRVRAEFVEDDDTRTRMIETLDDMKRMTESTLSFARDESVDEPGRLVDVSALVESVVDDMADLGKAVDFESTAPVPFTCRSANLKRALTNLIENALRYGGNAHVSVDATPEIVTITVDDDGPGIPEDKMTEVFEPFIRLESSRSRDTGGAGLGLAIARSIVLAHGGTITLENRLKGGLRAIMALPRRALG
ncbi:signal transduction histidine kinase [Rhodoligotrophos appendicifer]|uniref:ATP-binding protein n=1 Tax=Rhodoligotrophos appendicifer TaxID=987056 RepID=UPI00117C00A5|nr:ATP-binding protein [Rhodoligotrophos appendicifer]